MNITDIILIITIVIVLNLFVHSLASIIYKDFQYKQKIQNTIVLLIIVGIVCIVGSNYITNSIISNGLFYGGIMLIIAAIFGSWDSIGDEIKLIIMAGILSLIIWYSYNRSTTIQNE